MPGKQGFLLQWLRRESGINAGASQKKQFCNSSLAGGVDEVVLNLQVFKQKRRGLRVVGVNAADLAAAMNTNSGFVSAEEFFDRGGIQQVDLL